MSRIRNVAAVRCALGMLCATSGLWNSTSAVRGSDPDSFANHRILKSWLVGKHGGESTLLLGNVRVIFQDRAGIFWIGSGSGLYTFDEKRNLWVDFRDKENPRSFRYVKTLYQDKRGRIWLKSLNAELRFFDGKDWHTSARLAPPVRLPADNSVMFTGMDGTLWFVTADGLIAFDGQSWAPPEMPPQDIQGAYARLPLRYRNQNGSQKQPESELREVVVNDRAQLNDLRPEKDGNRVKHADTLLPTVYSGLQDRKGSIWLGAKRGIVRFSPENSTWTLYPLQTIVRARRLYEDGQNRIWVADEEGHLSVYSPQLDRWKSYDLSTYFPQLQPKAIQAIYQDKSGQMMIGIDGGGLVLFNENQNRWRILTAENSNPPVYGVTSIVEDRNGRIWIGMSEGILVLGQRG